MAKKYRTLKDIDVKGKRVIVRAGFDVSIEDGQVTDTERIEAVVPTIKHILKGGGSVILIAHQDRPKGKVVPEMSQKPIVPVLEKLLKKDVQFCAFCCGPEAEKAAKDLRPGDVLLLENLRFEKGEEQNDPAFAKELARLGDAYVNEAFTNAHRNHASMVALAKLLPSCMGFQLEQEVTHLSKALEDPRRPVTLIVSGAKMETKVPVIAHFLDKGDSILLGGAIANTFIAARGFDIGKSKYEAQQVEKAQELMLEADKEDKADILVPRDAVVASEASESASKLDLPLEDVVGDMCIFDIGKITIKRYADVIAKSGTIVWNGPVGMYELNRFSHGTKRLAEAVAAATKKGTVTIVGGGDTLDFHKRYGYPLDVYTFVSTGGGAMLEFVAGKPFASLAALAVSS